MAACYGRYASSQSNIAASRAVALRIRPGGCIAIGVERPGGVMCRGVEQAGALVAGALLFLARGAHEQTEVSSTPGPGDARGPLVETP